MLSNRDDIRARDLSNGDLLLVGSVEVDVVGSDTSGDTELELLGLGDEVGGKITGVKGSGDEDLNLGQLFLEDRVRSLLVIGDNEPGC